MQVLLLAVAVLTSQAHSVAQATPASNQATQTPIATAKPAGAPFRNQPSRIANRARLYYAMVWGIEDPAVKVVESGEMIRFTYRVVDAGKAIPLNDKKTEPSLISPEKGVKLVVPQLEKVGQLRQSATPEAGRAYWMAFSNKGGVIKRGDRVNIVIGNFHADGLQVQ